MDLYDIYLIGTNNNSEFRAIRDAILRYLESAGVDQSEVGIYSRLEMNGKSRNGKRPAVVACF